MRAATAAGAVSFGAQTLSASVFGTAGNGAFCIHAGSCIGAVAQHKLVLVGASASLAASEDVVCDGECCTVACVCVSSVALPM